MPLDAGVADSRITMYVIAVSRHGNLDCFVTRQPPLAALVSARPHPLLLLALNARLAHVLLGTVCHFPHAWGEICAEPQLVASAAAFPLAVGAHGFSFFQLPLRLMALALRLRLLAL